MVWKITKTVKNIPKLNNPVLIEGLPGIGNVGKIAVDFLKEELLAKKAYDIFSYTFPHSVFVNDKNLVELPSIELYYVEFKNKNKRDLLLLVGDVQPIDEVSCYEFVEKILDIAEEYNCSEIITMGGIGMANAPKKPKVYCTSNDKTLSLDYKKNYEVCIELYGVVGPIIGVTGLIVGMSQKRKIKAAALLAETLGHPMYLGIKGAKEIIKVLDKKFSLKLKTQKIDEEIKKIEAETGKADDFSQVSESNMLKKLKQSLGKDSDYIG